MKVVFEFDGAKYEASIESMGETNQSVLQLPSGQLLMVLGWLPEKGIQGVLSSLKEDRLQVSVQNVKVIKVEIITQ